MTAERGARCERTDGSEALEAPSDPSSDVRRAQEPNPFRGPLEPGRGTIPQLSERIGVSTAILIRNQLRVRQVALEEPVLRSVRLSSGEVRKEPPALDFIDDGRSLAALDHRDDRGHDEEEDQDCPQEKPGLE